MYLARNKSGQRTGKCNMESSQIKLKNSIVVGSVIENTKNDYSGLVLGTVLVPGMRVLTVRVRVQVLSSQLRVQVHCFRVQVLKFVLEYYSQVQVPSTITLASTWY